MYLKIEVIDPSNTWMDISTDKSIRKKTPQSLCFTQDHA